MSIRPTIDPRKARQRETLAAAVEAWEAENGPIPLVGSEANHDPWSGANQKALGKLTWNMASAHKAVCALPGCTGRLKDDGRVYCSPQCAGAARQGFVPMPICAASGCGNRVKRKEQKYCSVACSAPSRKTWIGRGQREVAEAARRKR